MFSALAPLVNLCLFVYIKNSDLNDINNMGHLKHAPIQWVQIFIYNNEVCALTDLFPFQVRQSDNWIQLFKVVYLRGRSVFLF